LDDLIAQLSAASQIGTQPCAPACGGLAPILVANGKTQGIPYKSLESFPGGGFVKRTQVWHLSVSFTVIDEIHHYFRKNRIEKQLMLEP
jgi:hypothetical protein